VGAGSSRREAIRSRGTRERDAESILGFGSRSTSLSSGGVDSVGYEGRNPPGGMGTGRLPGRRIRRKELHQMLYISNEK
jgi:hypothetical protein